MPQMCSGISMITILTSEAPKRRVSLPSSPGSWPIRAPQMLGPSSNFATTKAWIPRWADWANVTAVCRAVAVEMVGSLPP